MENINYLPIEYIFNLANLYRKGFAGDAKVVRLAMRRHGLRSLVGELGKDRWTIPRVPFWNRLCQAALLLDESPTFYPTLLMDEWLSWPFHQQIDHLLKAWGKVPENEKFQRLRKDLLVRLQHGLEINQSHHPELVGLQALGICAGNNLTGLGMALLGKKDTEKFSGLPIQTWKFENGRIIVPFPPDWRLLWEMERYIEPDESGSYPVDQSTLGLAAQRGAKENKPPLREILKRGLGEPPPVQLLDLLVGERRIRLVPGYVLEFSRPEDLKELRQSPSIRGELDRILSPRHVALDPWRGARVLLRLFRKGWLSESDFASIRQADLKPKQQPCHLSKSDRAYFLSLMLLVGELQHEFVPPPGLLDRITRGLENTLCAAAAKRATILLNQIKPQPAWQPEDEPPPPLPEDLTTVLQKVIDKEESITVLYQASGHHTPEYRHLTPLLVEQRGGRFYLIAYCHTRRANRTFRLDRLKLVEDQLEEKSEPAVDKEFIEEGGDA